MGPTVIDKGQPIEPIGSRLRDHTRTSDSGVRARSNSRRTLPGKGTDKTSYKDEPIRRERELKARGTYKEVLRLAFG